MSFKFKKKELKNKDFSHLITKVRFQTRYVSDDRKIRSSAVSNFFPTQRNSLSVGIMSYFKNDFALIIFILKETKVKN